MTLLFGASAALFSSICGLFGEYSFNKFVGRLCSIPSVAVGANPDRLDKSFDLPLPFNDESRASAAVAAIRFI
jgi:hypothetical protein